MATQLRLSHSTSQTSFFTMKMGRRSLSFCLTLSLVIIEVTSQVVWINQDTGEVLGVSPSKSNRPQYPQHNQQHQPPRGNFQPPNYPNNNRPRPPQQLPQGNPHWGRQPAPQNQFPEFSNPNVEWVCKNRGGDTMLIAREEINQASGQMPQSNQQTSPDKSYTHNPWLDTMQPQSVPKETPAAVPTTHMPIYQTTPAPEQVTQTQKSPFPSLESLDWTQFLQTTTKKPAVDLHSAISGEGVLEPRGGVVGY